jgi:CRISPR-associated protein Cst2
MKIQMASLSIAARATLDMHSLNNEGSEGNQIQTREADIAGADARMYHVNAISGDMLKHIQCEHFFNIARTTGLPLCAGCALFDANRVNADAAWIAHIPKTDREAISALLTHCALDDVAGTFITAGGETGKRAIRRDSAVEFGWVVGVPSLVQTGRYLHVKYASELSKEQVLADAAAREKEGSNLGQAIFYRPASSGVYALVCHIELGRVGYNDILHTYALDDAERTSRAKALLQSVLYTFLELNGAMRNTQLPHLVALQGILSWSQSPAIPAPLISPLAGGFENAQFFCEETRRVGRALSRGNETVIDSKSFEGISDFAVKMSDVIDQAVPASLIPPQENMDQSESK